MADHRVTVLNWLTQLKHLTRTGSEPVTRDKLAGYVLLLLEEFDSAVFTRQSLEAVSSGCEFFPAYAVLKTALMTWRDAPPPLRLSAPAPTIPDSLRQRVDEMRDDELWKARLADERSVVVADWKDHSKIRVAVRSLEGHPWRDRLGRMLAGLVSRHAPENIALLPPEWHEKPAA